jgi:di/tricarboxylate transporter
MPLPGPHAIAVLLIAVIAFYLYTRPSVRMELVALLLLVALVLTFYLFPLHEGPVRISDIDVLSGFGHPVLIAILCLMILGRGLLVTGALEPVVRLLTRLWKWSPALGLLVTLMFGVAASAFINDTPVLVMMLPMLLGIAERTDTSPAKTLMPVNFAVLGGGMLTTVGTSTNLLVISIAADLGVRQIGIFDFTAISAGALLVAIPYLWLVAPRLLTPRRASMKAQQRIYEGRLRVAEGQPLAGRTLDQVAKILGRALPLVQVCRKGEVLESASGLIFVAGDELLVADTPQGLREISAALAVDLFDQQGLGSFIAASRSSDDHGVVELVIGAKSLLCGKSLGEMRFAEQFGVVVIAVHRSDTDLLRSAMDLAQVSLQAGDLLLVQGPESHIARIGGQWDLMTLDSKHILPRTPLAPWALTIMTMVIALASFRVLPIHVAAMLGVVAMLMSGCVRFEGIGRALSLEVVLLVASSAVIAMEGWPPALQVASMMALSALLTNFVSNSASAAIGTPIAVTVAGQLGLPAEPFVLAILFGANLSYATPMAYQTNLLVMSAAGYSFRDFVKVGLPLVLLMLVTLSWLLVKHYSL